MNQRPPPLPGPVEVRLQIHAVPIEGSEFIMFIVELAPFTVFQMRLHKSDVPGIQRVLQTAAEQCGRIQVVGAPIPSIPRGTG